MAVLFISHSSKDDAHATALEKWLVANGFTDIFVDHESMAGGDKWREALRTAANTCRVVICLVSENWISSDECFNEFMAAWYMGRRIIPLTLLPPSAAFDPEVAGFARFLGFNLCSLTVLFCFDTCLTLSLRFIFALGLRLIAQPLLAGFCFQYCLPLTLGHLPRVLIAELSTTADGIDGHGTGAPAKRLPAHAIAKTPTIMAAIRPHWNFS